MAPRNMPQRSRKALHKLDRLVIAGISARPSPNASQRCWLAGFRNFARKASSPQSALSLSVQQATWLFFRKQADLDEAEQENLEQLRQAHPQIEKAYHLVSAFLQMMRERTGQQLEQWLSDVQESGLPEFESFLTGIQRDKDAVLARLTLPGATALRRAMSIDSSSSNEVCMVVPNLTYCGFACCIGPRPIGRKMLRRRAITLSHLFDRPNYDGTAQSSQGTKQHKDILWPLPGGGIALIQLERA